MVSHFLTACSISSEGVHDDGTFRLAESCHGEDRKTEAKIDDDDISNRSMSCFVFHERSKVEQRMLKSDMRKHRLLMTLAVPSHQHLFTDFMTYGMCKKETVANLI